MDDISRVRDGHRKFAVAKIHQIVKVDRQVVVRCDLQNPICAVVATV